jgi:hypothetical protein
MNNQNRLAGAPATLSHETLLSLELAHEKACEALQAIRQLSKGTHLMTFLDEDLRNGDSSIAPAQREGLADVLQSSGEVIERLLAYTQNDLEKAGMTISKARTTGRG